MREIEGLVQSCPLRKYRDQGNRVNQLNAPRSKKKRKQPRGGGNCSSGLDKKIKREDDAHEDGDYQYDAIIATISGLLKGKTKTSLKTEARAVPPGEPSNKRFKREEMITFSEKDPVPAVVPHNDAIIIEAVIANKLVKRVYIDTGASVNIIFRGCFDKMGVYKALVTSTARPLRSFSQEETQSDGVVELPVTVSRTAASSTEILEFFVVRATSRYNTYWDATG